MNRIVKKRILSIILIITGVLFGSNNSTSGTCLGDKVFTMLGLTSWSNGSTGTHYPAIIGLVCIMIGLGILSTTLHSHSIWQIIALIIITVGIVSAMVGSLKPQNEQKAEDIVILNDSDGEENSKGKSDTVIEISDFLQKFGKIY